MMIGTKNAEAAISTHKIPPAQNQTRIPSQSEKGPAISSPSGEIAVAPLPTRDMTRPCMSGPDDGLHQCADRSVRHGDHKSQQDVADDCQEEKIRRCQPDQHHTDPQTHDPCQRCNDLLLESAPDAKEDPPVIIPTPMTNSSSPSSMAPFPKCLVTSSGRRAVVGTSRKFRNSAIKIMVVKPGIVRI